LSIAPAAAPPELSALPFEFSMALGVRKADKALQAELDRALEKRASDINAILLEYGVPLRDMAANGRGGESAP
jgi:hypothetical protein